jgi:pilus assembly protein Flp/PilA
MMLQTLLFWLNRTLDTLGVRNTDGNPGEEGQGLVEYALILVLVSVAGLALLVIFGPTLANLFRNILVTIQGS